MIGAMQGILDFFNQAWGGSVIALLGIVVGALAALYSYLRSERGA